jgi:hypothetical protein
VEDEFTRRRGISREPRRYWDSQDTWLLHEEFDQYILAWDLRVHNVAISFRGARDRCLIQLDKIMQQITFESAELSANARDQINRFLLDDRCAKLRDAIVGHNFVLAEYHLRHLGHGVKGQFVSLGVYQHRINRVEVELSTLKAQIDSRNAGAVRSMSIEERLLLGLYLKQDPKNL